MASGPSDDACERGTVMPSNRAPSPYFPNAGYIILLRSSNRSGKRGNSGPSQPTYKEGEENLYIEPLGGRGRYCRVALCCWSGEASLLMRGVVVTHDLATALFAPYGERGGWVAGEEGELS